MLFSMKLIYDLDGVRVVVRDQFPNPKRPIAQKNQFGAQISIEDTPSRLQQLAESLCFANVAPIEHINAP